MASWTTDDLLNAIKPRAGLPASNGLLTDAEILQAANEVMDTLVAEALRSAGGTYGVALHADISIVANQATYAMPGRAQGAGALSLWFVDAGGELTEMPEVPPEESWRYQTGTSWTTPREGPYAYCWEGDKVRLLPTPTVASGKVRVKYFERPGRLVALSRCGPILFADTTTVLFMDTTTQAPSSLLTVAGASQFDIIDGSPPFSTLYRDRITSTYSAPNLTLQSATPVVVADVPSRAANDNLPRAWACPAYESCFAQIPVEAIALLIAGTTRAVCESIRDAMGYDLASRTIESELARLRKLLEPRTRANSGVVINRGSPLRSGGRWR